MITGAHAIVYSADAEADRAVLASLLSGRPRVDAGAGWLVLGLPPAEVAVHPTDGPPAHELYLMCDDLAATVADLAARGVTVEGGIAEARWGLITTIRLPGGGRLGLYEPRHPVAAGRHAVVPRMVVDDVGAAVAFMRDVFGATATVLDGPPTEVTIGDSTVMVSATGERAAFPAFLHVTVDDPDATYARALAAGATTIEEPADTPYGARRAMVRDPSGTLFQIARQDT